MPRRDRRQKGEEKKKRGGRQRNNENENETKDIDSGGERGKRDEEMGWERSYPII